jgi:transposase-like protein
LDDFEAEWGTEYPSIAPSWRRAWQEVILFFTFPPAVRKIIYTTNAIKNLNRVIRKTTKTRSGFPTDDAATKLIYWVIREFENTGRCVKERDAARLEAHTKALNKDILFDFETRNNLDEAQSCVSFPSVQLQGFTDTMTIFTLWWSLSDGIQLVSAEMSAQNFGRLGCPIGI